MRFTRWRRVAFTDTSRKRAAVLTNQRKAREKFPLFADEIAAQQRPVDEVMSDRALRWEIAEAEGRARRAQAWREARARLNQIPEPDRTIFLKWWNGHRWLPGDPVSLKDAIFQYQRGKYVVADNTIKSVHEIEAHNRLVAKVAAMSDTELLSMIQSHWSPVMVELGRAERLRRQSL